MKAIQYHALGEAEVLKLREVETPTLDPFDVLVKVHAAGINHLDIHFRRGLPGISSPLPHIPGSDASGWIQALGTSVPTDAGLKVGMPIMVNPGLPCQTCAFCTTERENLCHKYALMGRETNGSYAEYVKIRYQNVHPLPTHVNMDEAAVFSLVFLTAWSMLKKANVQKGDLGLIMGAGSGVSMAAIQLAHYIGADVLTTAGSDEKCALARSTFKCDEVINYRQIAIDEFVRKKTSKRGVDFVIDHVGGSQWQPILKSTRNGGTIVTCGATDGYAPTEDLRHIFFRQLRILGSTMGTTKEYEEVKHLFFENKVKPIIDSHFDLDQAEQAHCFLEQRKAFGKVILKI